MNQRYSPKLIQRTKQVWQPYADAPISDQDAIDILDGMLALSDAVTRLKGHREQA